MRTLTFKITKQYDGAQIKTVLRNHFCISSALITALKKDADGILLNYKPATVIQTVHPDDILTINVHEKASENIVATPMELDILYEDEDILAVNKPAGIATHPSIRHYTDTLANGIVAYYKGTPFTFRAITRLDKDTSGIVLIAKNRFSAEALSAQMRTEKIKKTYLAICQGVPNPLEGMVDAPISRDDGIIKRRIDSGGQCAKTLYKVLAHNTALSFVKASPITGKTHQIRLHMAHIAAPLYGDFLYGTEIQGGRTMLHCFTLTLVHPLTQEPMKLVAPPPSDFVEILKNNSLQAEYQ